MVLVLEMCCGRHRRRRVEDFIPSRGKTGLAGSLNRRPTTLGETPKKVVMILSCYLWHT